jgi:hypothetical protein
MILSVEAEKSLFVLVSPYLIKEIMRTFKNLSEGEDIEFFREVATEQAFQLIQEGKVLLQKIKEGRY